jgi:hypothetical protein
MAVPLTLSVVQITNLVRLTFSRGAGEAVFIVFVCAVEIFHGHCVSTNEFCLIAPARH